MVVLIIFPVILQTVINFIMLSIGGQGLTDRQTNSGKNITSLAEVINQTPHVKK